MAGTDRPYQTKHLSLFSELNHVIPVHETVGAQDPAALKLATLVCVATATLNRICQTGELDFVAWREQLNQRLATLELTASEEELEWLEEHLPYEPTLKGRIGTARRKLNKRLSGEPALPAGAILSLFMHGSIDEGVSTFRADEVSEPTATLTLQEPLHFACNRGAIYQFNECPVVAKMSASSLPSGLGTPEQEVERFLLESASDISRTDDTISLRYPSLNKVFPGIFNRLHLGKGKQNTGRSIYYFAAWKTRDDKGETEYRSLWSIREAVRLRTWKCPDPAV